MTGYSGTPLARKLGIKANSRVALLGAPQNIDAALAPLPDGVRIVRRLQPGLDVAMLFVTTRRELERKFSQVAGYLQPVGALWVAWPKKASGIASDLKEQTVMEVGLATGMVDNKVCAVDDVWSGLRFVVRLENRP